MKTNEVPASVEELMRKIDENFCFCSFAVNDDGKKAVFGGYGEDTDLPSVWIYEEESSTLRKLEDKEGVLIDFPLGRTYWAEDQNDLVVQDEVRNLLYTLKYDNKNYQISSLTKSGDDTYNKIISVKVCDFVHLWNNQELESEVAENPYKYCLEVFIDEFIENTKTIKDFYSMGGEGKSKEWNRIAMAYKLIVGALESAAEKSGISEEIPNISVHLTLNNTEE